MGRLTALLAKIKLGQKRLIFTNALAYYDTELISAKKSFIVLAPVVNFINILWS
jgi:hypothetical protein